MAADNGDAATGPWERDAPADVPPCPFGRSWCDPAADRIAEKCLSCFLRADRDGDPHPAVAAVADADGDADADKDVNR